MRVRFTPQAERQYFEALRYNRDRSPIGAATVQEWAEALVARLREQPHSGHTIPEFPELPHRELPVPPYRFFYRIMGDTVWILGVWHARQVPGQPDEGA